MIREREHSEELSTFKRLNEEIKAILHELEEHVGAHPYLNYRVLSKNNASFIDMLDQLLELRCTFEERKISFMSRP